MGFAFWSPSTPNRANFLISRCEDSIRTEYLHYPGERHYCPEVNGDPPPGIHGGPVRLVTPGLFGTMQIKWLARLRFETAESTNFYHAAEYRVPYAPVKAGDKFRFTMENSRPTWDIRLMSYILDPQPKAAVKAGSVTISGVAFNDGKARLESVLVSLDHGQS